MASNVIKRSSLNKLVVLKRIKHLSEQRQWSFLPSEVKAELERIPVPLGEYIWEKSIAYLEHNAATSFMRISEDEPKVL